MVEGLLGVVLHLVQVHHGAVPDLGQLGGSITTVLGLRACQGKEERGETLYAQQGVTLEEEEEDKGKEDRGDGRE